jgi:hypothetical protein
MENAMANTPSVKNQQSVWLDDKTKSIMDRAIAREQSLSRLLMTYIVTGLIFMLLPGTSWRMESHQNQQSGSSGIYLASLDSGTWSRPVVRPGRHFHPWDRFLLHSEVAEAEAVRALVSMAYVGALGRWRDGALVLEHLSMALADCATFLCCA